MLDIVCDLDMQIYFLGDLNIDWSLNNCSLKADCSVAADTWHKWSLPQQEFFYNVDETKTETCIDLLMQQICVQKQSQFVLALVIIILSQLIENPKSSN